MVCMLILHGQNIVLSRNKLREKTKNFFGETIILNGEKISLTDLKQAIESQSLFGQDRLVIIERLFSRPSGKAKEELLKYLKSENPQNLIIWEGKKVDGRVLTPFKQVKVEKFDLAPLIFKFLDSLSPKSKKISLSILHQCLVHDAPGVVFFMLCRQVKDLIIANDLGEKGLSELPVWKRGKLIRQAKGFGLKKLLWLYRQLLKIDYEQKTGKTPLSLSSQLDLLIASL